MVPVLGPRINRIGNLVLGLVLTNWTWWFVVLTRQSGYPRNTGHHWTIPKLQQDNETLIALGLRYKRVEEVTWSSLALHVMPQFLEHWSYNVSTQSRNMTVKSEGVDYYVVLNHSEPTQVLAMVRITSANIAGVGQGLC